MAWSAFCLAMRRLGLGFGFWQFEGPTTTLHSRGHDLLFWTYRRRCCLYLYLYIDRNSDDCAPHSALCPLCCFPWPRVADCYSAIAHAPSRVPTTKTAV